jgi:hypothetical protein
VVADAVVEVNVQRMDEEPDGDLTLLAQVAVKFRDRPQPLTRTFTIRKPPASTSVADEAAAESLAIGELADGLAAMLAR